jgi:hypothetical protein
MPEGNDDIAVLAPEFLGVLLTKIFLPDGQGEKAENPDVYSGDDLKENPIFPSPCFHSFLNSKLQEPNPKSIGIAKFEFIQDLYRLAMGYLGLGDFQPNFNFT